MPISRSGFSEMKSFPSPSLPLPYSQLNPSPLPVSVPSLFPLHSLTCIPLFIPSHSWFLYVYMCEHEEYGMVHSWLDNFGSIAKPGSIPTPIRLIPTRKGWALGRYLVLWTIILRDILDFGVFDSLYLYAQNWMSRSNSTCG